jgi:hypothetical protein
MLMEMGTVCDILISALCCLSVHIIIYVMKKLSHIITLCNCVLSLITELKENYINFNLREA